jgi:DNA adenine methylase
VDAHRYPAGGAVLLSADLYFGARAKSRAFGAGTTSGPKLNLLRNEEKLGDAHLRLARTTVEHLDWKKCIRRYDRVHTLFYLAPPHWETAGCDAGEFGFEHFEAMTELARTIRGKMVISVGDHPRIREVFAGLSLKEVPFRQTVGDNGGTEVNELVYFNW